MTTKKTSPLHSKLLSLLLAGSMLLGMLPMIAPRAAAADKTDVVPAGDTTITSDFMKISVSTNTTNPTIKMSENYKGNWGYSYQYGTSNGFYSLTADALVADGTADVLDPAHWQTPQLVISGAAGSNTGVINGATNQNATTGGPTLFNVVTRVYTEDRINNTTGKAGNDGQADVIGMVGSANGAAGAEIELEFRISLNVNTVTGKVDMARYTIAATNKSTTQAKAYGTSWNVDTWSGSSDAAQFQAQGVSQFGVEQVSFNFPTPDGAPWSTYMPGGNIYKNSLPKYLYGIDPNADADGEHFVSIMYPQISRDSNYSGTTFEKADYFGMAYFGSVRYSYFFYSPTGAAIAGVDSGHIVRYNPRLLLPGETKYFGIDYGQGQVGQAAADVPSITVNNAELELLLTDDRTGYVNSVNADVLYQNPGTTSYAARMRMTLDSRYLKPSQGMRDGGWAVVDNTDPNHQIWEKDLGALSANTGETSMIPALDVVGIPVTEGDVTTTMSLDLMLSPDGPDDTVTQYRHWEGEVKLPKCDSRSLKGWVWRDVNSDGNMQDFEGLANIPVELYTDHADGNGPVLDPVTTGDKRNPAKSVAKGVVTGPGGISQSLDQYLTIGELEGDLQRYTVGDIKWAVKDSSGNVIDASTVLAVCELSSVNGRLALHYRFIPGKAGNIEYKIELRSKAMLALRPYAPTNLSDSYSDAAKVESGSYDLSYGSVHVNNAPVNAVPVQVSATAGANVTATYHAPQGYRATDGSTSITKSLNNITAWYPGNTVIAVDFPLVKGDLRLTGLTDTSAGSSLTAAATGIETAQATVTVAKTLWSGKSARLDFRAWNTTGEVTGDALQRGSYTWSIVNDPDGILTGVTPNNGVVTFSGVVGSATVRVTNNSMTQMYHEMKIVVTPEVISAYDQVYLADAANQRLTEVSVALNLSKDVRVVGETGGVVTPIPNTAAVTFVYGTAGLFTVAPAPGADSNLFRLTGAASGYGSVTPQYGANTGLATNVLVTRQPVTAGTTLKITPNPLEGRPGTETAVSYWLRFDNNTANDQQLPAAAVSASLGGNTVATVEEGGAKLRFAALGNDSLTAVLKADTAKTDTVAVHGKSSTDPVPEGTKLGLAERKATPTNGFLSVGADTEYAAYLDANSNGTYDAGEIVLSYSEATWSVQGSKVTIAAGTQPDQVKVTGAATGVDKLTATYAQGGQTYTASVDLVVRSAGPMTESLEITPAATVLHPGNSGVFTVRAVFAVNGGIEKYTLPASMYQSGTTLSGGTGVPAESNTSVIKLASGTKNQITAVANGEAELWVKASVGEICAKILVVAEGTQLKVSPKPLWVAKNEQAALTYTLSPTAAVTDLAQYVTATPGDSSVARLVNGAQAVTGLKVGRTDLSVRLNGLSEAGAADATTVYVYDSTNAANTLRFKPDTLALNAGAAGTAQVKLMDGATEVATVDSGDLLLTMSQADVATLTPTGSSLKVAAKNLTVNKSTVVSASVPGRDAIGATHLTVNVKGSESGDVSGLTASPVVIELWPGESKPVTVTDTATGQSLTADVLAALGKAYTAADVNTAEVDATNRTLVLKQAAGAPSGVNILTLSLNGQTTTVTILNFTSNPYDGNHEMKLAFTPASTELVKNGAAKDVLVSLVTTDTRTNAVTDTLPLAAGLITYRANTQSSLSGSITIAPAAAADKTLTLTGTGEGGAAYTVTYKSNQGRNITGTGGAFVFAQDPATIPEGGFKLDPATMLLNVGQSAGLTGLITYPDNTTQAIRATELPYAVPGLAVTGTAGVASVGATGVVKGLSAKGRPSQQVQVTGTLIGTSRTAASEVVVIAANTVLAVEPNPIILTTGETLSVRTKLVMEDGTSEVFPNRFISYSLSNGNATVVQTGDNATITGAAEGTAALTATLNGNSRSATAAVTVFHSTAPGDFTGYTLKLTPDPLLVQVGGSQMFFAALVDSTTGRATGMATNGLTVSGTAPTHSRLDLNSGSASGLSMGFDNVTLRFSRTKIDASGAAVQEVVAQGSLLIIAHGDGEQTIRINNVPVRKVLTNNQPVTAALDYADTSAATVLWVITDSNVATFSENVGTPAPGTMVYRETRGSAPLDSNVKINWHAGLTAGLKAYVLESGNSDSTLLMSEDLTINSMEFTPDAVSLLEGDRKAMDELGTFRATLRTNHGDIQASLADFDIVSGGGEGDAAVKTAAGASADQVLYGARPGATDLTLQYRYAQNAYQHKKIVTVYVRPAAPVEIRFYGADGHRLDSVSMAVGERLEVTPKYAMSNGTEQEIDFTKAPTWSIGGNATYTASDVGGKLRLTLHSSIPFSDRLVGSKTTTYGEPGPVLTLTATGNLPIQIRQGELIVEDHSYAGTYTKGDAVKTIDGDVKDGATLAGGGTPAGLTNATIVAGTPGSAPNTYMGLWGVLRLNLDGTFRYTPNSSLTQTSGIVSDVFTYQIQNGASGAYARAKLTFRFTVSDSVSGDVYRISGKVVDKRTGNAIPNAIISVDGVVNTVTGTDGRYTLSGSVAGDARVSVKATADGYHDGGAYVSMSGANVDNANMELTPRAASDQYLVSGYVIDTETGRGVANATVTMGAQTVTSDASGRYLFLEPVSAGTTHTVRAVADGYTFEGTINIPAVDADVTDANIELTPAPAEEAHSIAGRIVNAETGLGISGAVATLLYDGYLYTATANAEGAYRLPGTYPNGAYTIYASAAGYSTGSISVTVADRNVTNADIQLTAAPEAGSYQLSGRVTDAATGAAMSGIRVQLVGGAFTTTDAEGRYAFDNLADGTYFLTADAFGYETAEETATVRGAGVSNVDFALVKRDMEHAYQVSGRVTDAENGAGIPNATVTMDHATAVTGADGTYSFGARKFYSGDYEAVVTAAGYGAAGFTVSVSDADVIDANAALTAIPPAGAYLISGKVTDGGGTALSGATVTLDGTSQTATTNDSGEFAFETAVANGSYTVRAMSTGYQPGERVITVNGANVTDADLSLAIIPPVGNYRISGKVLDNTGTAISGATVSMAGQPNITTGVDGSYAFPTAVPNGSYTVTAAKSGYDTSAITVTVNGADYTSANLTLITSITPPDPTYTVSGKVLDATSRSGITGATVTMDGQTTTTGADGAYSFTTPVVNGTYTVRASAGGYNAGQAVVTVSGVNVTDANIALTATSGGGGTGGGGSGGGSAVTQYTLTFETNGGTAISPITENKGTVVELKQVTTRGGYTFAGWYADKALTEAITSVTLKANTTVYAKWEEQSGKIDWNKTEHDAYIIGAGGMVRPTANITRAEVATILYRMMTEASRKEYQTSANSFSDMKGTEWYNTEVSTMTKAGIIQGLPGGVFGGELMITRAELAALMVRANGGSGSYTGADKFGDISTSWARGYINEAAELGLVIGVGKDIFQPEAYITRAEVMTMINRFLGRDKVDSSSVLSGMKTWTDNSDTNTWYYYAVQEATNGHEFSRRSDEMETWTRLVP